MAHMVPHVEIEANHTAALGGCCSRFSDEAVVVYKDDRLELNEYHISCCSGGERARQRRRDDTIKALDGKFYEAYGVNFRDVPGGEIDFTEDITFVQFKAVRNRALHDRLVRLYGVTLKEAVDALRIDIDPEKGLSSLDVEEIEGWAKRNGKQQDTEYDVRLSPMPSYEELPKKSPDGIKPLSEEPPQDGLSQTDSQNLRLTRLIQGVVLQVVSALTPRQIQAMRRGPDSHRTAEDRKSIEGHRSAGVKKEVENAMEVDRS